ncbi:hypothetical protein EDB87DRAFT_1662902 [Lactarius vividus]|nr:hypothetical protein EDB87DRAFT_1662902 [Lactarius vividus]
MKNISEPERTFPSTQCQLPAIGHDFSQAGLVPTALLYEDAIRNEGAIISSTQMPLVNLWQEDQSPAYCKDKRDVYEETGKDGMSFRSPLSECSINLPRQTHSKPIVNALSIIWTQATSFNVET